MAKRKNKLTGPYTIRIETGRGNGTSWQTETLSSLEETRNIAYRTIKNWLEEDLTQLRKGAFLYVNEDFSEKKSIKIFNSEDCLVTNEVIHS